MLVILPIGKEKEWLERDSSTAKEILNPYPTEEMEMYELTSKINDSPDVIEAKTSKGTLTEYMK